MVQAVVWVGALVLMACSADGMGSGRAKGAGGDGAGDGSGTGGTFGNPDMTMPNIAAGAEPINDVITPGEPTCGEATLNPLVQFSPGNLLVVFDRSLSMNADFYGQPRLTAASDALIAGIGPYACPAMDATCTDTLTVGAVMFPSVGNTLGGCLVDEITTTEQIDWQGAASFIESWALYWQTHQLVLGTPITTAFERADTAIAGSTLTGNTAVLFLTDGDGTCGVGTPVDAMAGQWLTQGIPTYVVSVAAPPLAIPGIPLPAAGQEFNDNVALAGGTNASINPADTNELATAIGEVLQATSSVASCSIPLDGGQLSDLEAACTRGQVMVGANVIACDQQGRTEGFFVKSAEEIELVGDACASLMASGQLTATFPCDIIVPD